MKNTHDLEKEKALQIRYKNIEIDIWEFGNLLQHEGRGFVIDMFKEGESEPFKSVITSLEEAK